MKKIIFVLPLLAMMVVGCKNPTVPTETPVEETPTVEAPKEGGNTPETPPSNPPASTPTPEDKSPYEYVKPACVNLADYTYVGDYIFADTMNFAEWKYSNSVTNYTLAFEKIARVKNDNPATRIIRYPHNATSEDDAISVVKATKYKIYVKTSVVSNTANNSNILNTSNKTLDETYDGTQVRIRKVDDDLTITFFEGNISDYIAY